MSKTTVVGAVFLLRFVRNMDGSAHKDLSGIFGPHNNAYIVRGGFSLVR